MPQVAFLYPLFLAGAAAAAVPIVLHLLRRDTTRDIPFSAVRFLKRAPVEQARHRRLRELLLLALRVAALLLLAFAFARPYLVDATGAAASDLTVVAIDTSYSMTAPGRFATAQRLAVEAVRDAPAGHAVAVLAFDDGVRVVVAPTADRVVAQQAVRNAVPSFGATRYGVALGRAAALIGSRDGRIVVVTDLQRTGWDTAEQASVPQRVALEVRDVGSTAGNLAVQQLRRDGAEVVATIFNSGAARVNSTADVSVDGRKIGTVPFVSDPAITTEVRFVQPLPSSGGLRVAVRDPGGYEADNERYLVLDPPAPPAILLLQASTEAAGFYLSRALGPTDDTARFRVVQGEPSVLTRPGALREHSAVVLLATQGLDRRGREALAQYVQQGGGLFIVTGAALDPAMAAAMFDGRPQLGIASSRAAASTVSFTASDPRHPVFRPLAEFAAQLGRASFTRTVLLTEPDGVRVLGRFSDGSPALVEYAAGAGRIIVFASDLNNRWNNLPLQPIFVPFAHEVMRYLVGARELPSEFLVADAPDGVEPRPGVITMPVAPTVVRVGGRDAAGTGRRVAINVDPREADTHRMSIADFRKAVVPLNATASERERTDATTAEASQSYWRYGLILMLVALGVEGLLGSRMV